MKDKYFQQRNEFSAASLNEQEYPYDQYIHELFEIQVGKTPDRVAVSFEQEFLTYRDLNQRANQLAHHIRSLGVKQEILVGICVERSLEMIIGLLAILKAGATYVPLDPDHPEKRLAFLLEDAHVSLLLTQERLRARLSIYGEPILCLDTDWDAIAREPWSNPKSDLCGENLAYVIYTSGSTGQPKGAMNTHRALSNRLLWMQETYRLTPNDRVLQKTPFSFDVSIWEFFWPLITGACLVIARPEGHRDSSYLVHVIIEQSITTIHFVPSMLSIFLEERGVELCQSLTRVICSGEALSFDLQERFFRRLRACLENLYGPTEAAIDVTFWSCQSGDDKRSVPIGSPIRNIEIYLLDETLQPVPEGRPGELYIGGVGLARGYMGRPDLTAERFIPHPFSHEIGLRLYKTGDLACYLPSGKIEYLGRLDNQVKIRGFRIELEEVEAVLAQHSAIRDAVVVTRQEGLGDIRLQAYLIPAQQSASTVLQLLSLERQGFPDGAQAYELPNGLTVITRNKSEASFVFREIFEDLDYTTYGITFNEGDIIFDVGAHIGLFTLFAAQTAEKATIYAFEPAPALAELLHINTRLYNLDVTIFHYGLSSKSEYTPFVYYPQNTIMSGRFADSLEDREVVKTFLLNQQQASSSTLPVTDEHDQLDQFLTQTLNGEEFLIEVRTLSEVIEELGIKYIDLLKIDVEKSEMDVLTGIQERDWHKIKQLIIEVHDRDNRLSEIVLLLEAHSYQLCIQENRLLKGTNLYTVYAVRQLRDQASEQKRKEKRLAQGSSSRWYSSRRLIADVQQFAKDRLPEYMVPVLYALLEDLPLTPNGKIDRHALPEPKLIRWEDDFRSPGNLTESILADIWREVLKREQVSITADFFELGGHSLLATQVLARVRTLLQAELSFKEFFQARTVTRLAECIEEHRRTGEDQPAIPFAFQKDEEYYPLSFSQERVWFLQQLHPEMMAYNFQATLRIVGALNIALLERSLSEIIKRHEIFRTTFPAIDGQPTQQIHSPWKVHLQVIDIQFAADTEAEMQKLLREELCKPFDLTQLPLIRWKLFLVDPQEYLLVHVEHHLVHDGWSFNVFLGELTAFYQAFSTGQTLRLPELPLQFVEFAKWQRRWVQSTEAERQLSYWKEKLRGQLPVLELSIARPRTAIQTFRGTAQRIELPLDLCEALRAFGRREGVTLFMVMFTAFGIMLHHYSTQNDICIGTGIANRRWQETESLIGMVINSLALRLDFSDNPTIRDLLHRVRTLTLEAYAHQDLPFDKVVEAIQPERTLSYTPIFQTFFSFHDAPLPDIQLPGVAIDITEGLNNGSAKFDLSIIAIPRAEQRIGQKHQEESRGLTLIWEYNTDLFDHQSITRMVQHYFVVLESVVTHPDKPLSWLSLVTTAEKQQLLITWNATNVEYPQTQCLHHLFEAQVDRTPEAVAVVCAEQQLTYRELNARANQIAHFLRQSGIEVGALVGLCLPPSLEMVIAIFGVLKAGGGYVPLDPGYPSERLAFMLADSQAAMLLTLISVRERIPTYPGPIISLDADWPEISQARTDRLESRVGSANLAYVIYTSGSTGRPKGAGVYHRGVVNLVHWFRTEFQITSDDTTCIITSYSFDLTQKNIYTPLLVGGRVVLFPKDLYDVGVICQEMDEQRVTLLNCTPSAFYPLVEYASQHPEPFGQLALLRHLFLGGEPVISSRLQEWLHSPACHAEIVNTYGPTECTDVVAFYRLGWDEPEEFIPIGKPISNVKLLILDQELRLMPIGIAGELCILGESVGAGYIHDLTLTNRSFVPHPYTDECRSLLYKTGDIARYRSDGNIELLGRMDQQIKIRGFRVDPGEIEASVRDCPEVQECVVVSSEETPESKRLIAYVVPKQGISLSVSSLRSLLKERLPNYMIPAAFILLDSLPLTVNGKLDHKELPVLVQSMDTSASSLIEEPRDWVELQIAHIFEEVLGVHPVGIRQSFFDLGGHSLMAIRLMAYISQKFGKDLPLAMLFQTQTVETLAELIRTYGGWVPPSLLVAIEPRGTKLPLYGIPPGGEVLCYLRLARYLGPDQPFYGLQVLSSYLSAEKSEISHTITVEALAQEYVQVLLAHQPEGPYQLLGWSLSGLVAFEMALCLQAQGHEVSLLALLDTWIPGIGPEAEAFDDAAQIAETVRVWAVDIARWAVQARSLERPPDVLSTEILKQMPLEQQVNYYLEFAKSLQAIPSDVPPDYIHQYLRVTLMNTQASFRYIPQGSFQGSIHLFRAEGNIRQKEGTDLTLGWSALSSEPVTIHLVSGTHETVVYEPHVSILAKHLQQSLGSFAHQ